MNQNFYSTVKLLSNCESFEMAAGLKNKIDTIFAAIKKISIKVKKH